MSRREGGESAYEFQIERGNEISQTSLRRVGRGLREVRRHFWIGIKY
jgi:hypothetical protein